VESWLMACDAKSSVGRGQGDFSDMRPGRVCRR